jgi:hypothetical protein
MTADKERVVRGVNKKNQNKEKGRQGLKEEQTGKGATWVECVDQVSTVLDPSLRKPADTSKHRCRMSNRKR